MPIFYSKCPKWNGQNRCKRQSKPDASILPYHQESDYYLYNVRNLIVRIGFIDRSPTQDYGQAPSKQAGRQPRQQSGRKAVAASGDGGSRHSYLQRAAPPGSGSLLLSCMINGMENAWSYGRLTTSVVSSQLFSTGIYYMAEKRQQVLYYKRSHATAAAL